MSGVENNYVLKVSAASLHNANFSSRPNLTGPAIEPAIDARLVASVAESKAQGTSLSNVFLPNAETIQSAANENLTTQEVKSNNRVTRAVNPDGSVTYEGYGIKGTVKEIDLKDGVKGIEQSWTISNAPQYQELGDKVKALFQAQYPDKRDYYIADFDANLKDGTIITILDDNGKAVSNKNYNQHESLGKEHNLELAPSELRPGLAMLHLLKRAFYEFKESNGTPLEYNSSSNRYDIGSVDDPASTGNYALRFKAEPGSGCSPGLSVNSRKVRGYDFHVDGADDDLSAAFVLSVPESKS